MASGSFRDAAERPAYFVRVEWDGERIAQIRDYYYVPTIVDGARFVASADDHDDTDREPTATARSREDRPDYRRAIARPDLPRRMGGLGWVSRGASKTGWC